MAVVGAGDIALVANAAAGTYDAAAIDASVTRCGARVVQQVTVQEVDQIEGGIDRIVVAGGDGSIAPAAACASRLGVPLAVIPMGTANDFARAVGLPTDPDEACDVAAGGASLRSFDLGFIGDRPFVNVASTGLSRPAARRAHGLKGLLGPLAYAVGAISAGFRARPLPCTVTTTDRELFDGHAWQLMIANTGAFGGGAHLDDACARDGALDVIVIPVHSRIGLVVRAWGLRRGSIAEQAGVRDQQAPEVEVATPDGTLWIVDGEVVKVEGRTVRFSVVPRAFELVTG